MPTVRVLMVAEFECDPASEATAQAKLDAFREAVLPSLHHGVSLWRFRRGEDKGLLEKGFLVVRPKLPPHLWDVTLSITDKGERKKPSLQVLAHDEEEACRIGENEAADFIPWDEVHGSTAVPAKCARKACGSNYAACKHTQSGYYYCPKCARKINEANPGLVKFPDKHTTPGAP